MTQKLNVILRDAKWLTPDRIRRIALVFAAVELMALAIEWWLQSRPHVPEFVAVPFGDDFVNYWTGATLAFRGHVALVYDQVAFSHYEQSHVAPFSVFRWYAYPPVALLLSAPLALLPYVPAYILWLTSGTGLCALLFSRLMRWPMALLAAFATPAVFFNTVSGQNGQFTAALLAGGLMLLDERPIVSGVLFGMLCYKPQFGILIPVALVASGRWKALASATVAVAMLTGATVLLFGWDAWLRYLGVASLNQTILEQGMLPHLQFAQGMPANFWHRMTTVFAALRLAGAGIGAAYAAQALSTAGALAATIAVWRSPAPREIKSAALILATLLATPYAWDYDLVVLTFAVVWLWQNAAMRGFLPYEKAILAGILAMTLFFAAAGKTGHVVLAPIFLWIALMFAVRRALDPVAAKPPKAS